MHLIQRLIRRRHDHAIADARLLTEYAILNNSN